MNDRNSVEIWNDSTVLDACIAFSSYGYVNGAAPITTPFDVTAASATFCRRLPSRTSLSLDVKTSVNLLCVSSASAIVGPNIHITQLKK